VEQYDGVFPKDFKSLKALKGIGEYTAGAIASIAYEQREPAVDGNVMRVVTRITGNSGDIKLGKTKKEITEEVRKLLPEDNIGDFNQGLIELGAVMCTSAKKPDCEICPVSEFCVAYEKNLQGVLPVKGKGIKKRLEKKTVVILTHRDKIFLRKREDKGLLAGLWEFPNIEGHLRKGALEKLLDRESCFEKENLEVGKITKLEDSKAVFSHIQWNLIAYQVELVATKKDKEKSHAKDTLEEDTGSEYGRVGKTDNTEEPGQLNIIEDPELLDIYEEDLMEKGRWISKEVIRQEYSIASAFKTYRKEVL